MGPAMSRYSVSLVEELLWVEVSPDRPCRVCDAVRVCATLESGEFAHCSATVSEWPVLDGGWLHRLEEPSRRPIAMTPA